MLLWIPPIFSLFCQAVYMLNQANHLNPLSGEGADSEDIPRHQGMLDQRKNS